MADKLTPEQILTKVEAAFLPHHAKAKFQDFGDKITVAVRSAKDGTHITTFSSSLVHELQVEHFLDDWIGGLRREVSDMVDGRFP